MDSMDIKQVYIDRKFIVELLKNIDKLKRERDVVKDSDPWEYRLKSEMLSLEYITCAHILKFSLNINDEEIQHEKSI
jgi:hypothetical protein